MSAAHKFKKTAAPVKIKPKHSSAILKFEINNIKDKLMRRIKRIENSVKRIV